MIENTADRDPMIHLLGAMSDGTSGYIEGLEAAGQQQLVHSDRLPTELSHNTDADFTALGFTFGEPDKRDPMFRPAALPAGWKRKGSDHSMWSYVVDEHGRERVAIFYKAAFYDRSAFMSLSTVYSYATQVIDGRAPAPVFDDQWCTRDAFVAALQGIRLNRVESLSLYIGRDDAYSVERRSDLKAEITKVDALLAEHDADGAR